MNKIIKVTQPTLPPLREFIPYLEEIWESKWLTNNGPFHQQFEKRLAEYLGVKFVSLFANGTLALMTALQVLSIKGEVITTPYTFVATTNALWWNGIKPIFVDIEKNHCNLDPENIEQAITKDTTAIIPVHVYGNPCYVERIDQIAKKHNLNVIYDAAHAFSVKINGKSIHEFGDLSILSFHATKVFNTMEGGAIVSHSKEMKTKIDKYKNFGFKDEISVTMPGFNAKMNEMQAALGLLQLKRHKNSIQKRKNVDQAYRKFLKGITGVSCLQLRTDTEMDYPYFPIFVNETHYGKKRDQLYEELKNNNIFGRRYFYPLVSQFPIYCNLKSARKGVNPIAEKISKEVIALPLFPELDIETIKFIVSIIKNFAV